MYAPMYETLLMAHLSLETLVKQTKRILQRHYRGSTRMLLGYIYSTTVPVLLFILHTVSSGLLCSVADLEL